MDVSPVSSTGRLASRAALDLYEKALGQYQSYVGDPIATIDEALAIEPTFLLGHVFRAVVLTTFSERRFVESARVSVATAEALLPRATRRELGLASAARRLVDGDWDGACRDFDRVLVDHPTDAFAIQSAHLMDFFRGDALNLRNRISRVLPHWSPSMPGYSYVLGMHAFGLEECNEYTKAEETGRRALELQRKDAWAVHAVTHVMEMQGRIDEGITWLRTREPDWAPDNSFAFHNFWHLALYYLDRQRYAEALAIYDTRLHASPPDASLQLVDATALLFRLYLEGVDVASRAEALAPGWADRLDVERGFYAFNDVHAMMAFIMAGRAPEAARIVSDLAWAAEHGGASNRAMSRDVGLPVAKAIQAFGRGRYAEAIDLLEPVRDIAHHFGGSHAQRDVLTLTLVEAAIRAGRASLARHYIAERTVHKPASALGARLLERTEGVEVDRVRLPNGVELEYAERGEGPAVIFLHGLSDSRHAYGEILRRLPAGLRGIAITQRGHGDSSRPEGGYRIEDFAADVVAFMDAVGVTTATIVGHSMGSLVAQEVASAYPQRVARLVLVGSATTFDNDVVGELAAAVDQLTDPLDRKFVFDFQASTVTRPIDPAFLEAMVDASMKMPSRVWRAALDGTRKYSSAGRLERIFAPTLLVWGAGDSICSREEQDALGARIRGSVLSVYTDSGHTPQWEEPARFVDEIVSFIESVPPPSTLPDA